MDDIFLGILDKGKLLEYDIDSTTNIENVLNLNHSLRAVVFHKHVDQYTNNMASDLCPLVCILHFQ